MSPASTTPSRALCFVAILLLVQVIRMVGESQETVGAGVGGSQSAGSNKLPTLSEYGTNLTQQAAEVSAHAPRCP